MASAINEYTCLMSTEGTAVKFNYLKIKELKKSQFVNSPIFVTGGRTWSIACSLEGNNYVSLFLQICEYQENVNAIFSMYLLYKDGKPSWTTLRTASYVFRLSGADILSSGLEYRGFSRFVKTTDLEEKYINDQGCFVVVYAVKLEGESCEANMRRFVEISRFNMHEDFNKLLEKREMSDVTFKVEGEIFVAHKLILAARSPVFKAELFGSNGGSQMRSIDIKGTQPDVFRSLLHFIYTDSILEFDEENASFMMTQNLLVAADRYGIERLKLICEDMLCKSKPEFIFSKIYVEIIK